MTKRYTKHLPPKRALAWFEDRIGTIVVQEAKYLKTNVRITSSDHAKWLYGLQLEGVVFNDKTYKGK